MTGKSFPSLTHAIVLAMLLGSQVSTAAEVEGQLVGAASWRRPFHRERICYPCPSVTIEPGEEDFGPIAPGEGLGESPADVGAVAPPSIMAGGLGAAPAPGAVTPNMIGDFFGGGMAFLPSFGSAKPRRIISCNECRDSRNESERVGTVARLAGRLPIWPNPLASNSLTAVLTAMFGRDSWLGKR